MTFNEAKIGDLVYSVEVRHTPFEHVLLRELEIVNMEVEVDYPEPFIRLSLVETQNHNNAYITIANGNFSCISNSVCSYYGLSFEDAISHLRAEMAKIRGYFQRDIKRSFDQGLRYPKAPIYGLQTYKEVSTMNVVRLMFNIKRNQ